MKRMLKFTTLFTVLALLVSLIAGGALAAGSKSDVVEVTAVADGSDVELSFADASVELTAEKAASLVEGAKTEEMKVIWQQDITSAVLPADLTFKVDLEADQEGYVYHYEGSDWVLMGKVNASITFSDLSPVGVAVRTVSSSAPAEDGEEKSPETGDNGLILALACIAVVMGGAVACVSLKKKA